jgi:hypothetical protein
LQVLPVDGFFGFKNAIEEYHLEVNSAMRRQLVLKDENEDPDALDNLLGTHPDMTASFARDDNLAVRVSALLGRLVGMCRSTSPCSPRAACSINRFGKSHA